MLVSITALFLKTVSGHESQAHVRSLLYIAIIFQSWDQNVSKFIYVLDLLAGPVTGSSRHSVCSSLTCSSDCCRGGRCAKGRSRSGVRTAAAAGLILSHVVCSYISFCTNKVIPMKTVKSFPNRKPWASSALEAKMLLICRAVRKMKGNREWYEIHHWVR